MDALRRAERVLVIGCGGSGKSSLAMRLAPCFGLPVTHLDALFWHPGWVPTAAGAWDAIEAALVAQPKWLIDGDYGRTLPMRLARADVVIWLDLPTATCLWRALVRQSGRRGKVRPDLAAGCPEHIDLGFLLGIATYRRRRRPILLQQRAAASVTQTWITLSSASSVPRFVAGLTATPAQRAQPPSL